MSSHLGVTQSLELLEQLRSTVRDFAAREAKVNRDLTERVAKERHWRERGSTQLGQALTTATAAADAALQVGREYSEARYRQRQSRLAGAFKASKKSALDTAEKWVVARRLELQQQELQTARDRETGLQAAQEMAGQFRAELAGDNATLAVVVQRAHDAFCGYARFRRALLAEPTAADAAGDEVQLQAALRDALAQAGVDLEQFERLWLPQFFQHRWVWLVLTLGLIPLALFLQKFGVPSLQLVHALGAVGGCIGIGVVLHQAGRSQGAPGAKRIAATIGQARTLAARCDVRAQEHCAEDQARVEREFSERNAKVQSEWKRAVAEGEARRAAGQQRVEAKATRVNARNEATRQQLLDSYERAHAATIEQLEADATARQAEVANASGAVEDRLNAEHRAQWQQMETEWTVKAQPLGARLAETIVAADAQFPDWTPELLRNWTAPSAFSHAAKFASLDVELEKLCEGVPRDPRLPLPCAPRFTLPLTLAYPQQGSVLFETNGPGREEAIAALNNIVLRLLATAPPGRLSFTIVDPVGLGQSFSGVMHLTDFADHLINGRIWTQTAQIDQRLANLNEHMEKVIQMYLRNEYATIAEYNEQAGNIAEKYHFLVVADFPAGFSETAAKRLLSIAASGARCGVFTLIHWDRRQAAPQDFVPEDLRQASVCVAGGKGREFMLGGKLLPGAVLSLEAPPASELAIQFIQRVGQSSRDSNRVEVPFAHVAPSEAEMWTHDTTGELRVPIGRTGATKLQYLAIGKGTRQHALLAGKTGSGKSSLLHVVITNLALWCSPEQVEFYLIDFKKGVEFKCYGAQRLPHARVVAIESDREFGLSVLQRLDDELRKRGDLFRKLGAQDIPGYKRAGGMEPMPRSLLIIDEVQEFFTEDDKIAQTASLLLDRIVRQGRAFGVHVLLGSQTLGGAYTVARTTLGQMVIRIALQCNEADAYLIMDDKNPAPRLLSRPGEGIYNDTAGSVEGNSPFQAVWLPDEVRDECLAKVRAHADRHAPAYAGPIVFEGNAPADISENAPLRNLLGAPAAAPPAPPRIWLGAPNSIKGPTEIVFHRQSGNNLLLVGQRDEAVLAIVTAALFALAAQAPPGGARIIVCDGSAPGSSPREYLDRVIASIPQPITSAKQSDLPELMKRLNDEMKQRAEDTELAGTPPTFLLIHGLQKFNKLRYEEDFSFAAADADAPPNPAVLLNTLLTEGTRLGFHVIATCDTFNNVNRFLSRKALSEFEMRVLFQMSANDSASLIDSPKAGTLGLHRALFYNAQEGYLETFRPYALPGSEWLDAAAQNLSRLLGGDGR